MATDRDSIITNMNITRHVVERYCLRVLHIDAETGARHFIEQLIRNGEMVEKPDVIFFNLDEYQLVVDKQLNVLTLYENKPKRIKPAKINQKPGTRVFKYKVPLDRHH